MLRTTKVVFVDPQPNPDGTGPSKTTFDNALPSMSAWSFVKEGDEMLIKDDAGHELRVPYVRVLRRWLERAPQA